MKTKLIVVAGPTAVGKRRPRVNWQQWRSISGDSQRVYRQLNIGTARPLLKSRLQQCII